MTPHVGVRTCRRTHEHARRVRSAMSSCTEGYHFIAPFHLKHRESSSLRARLRPCWVVGSPVRWGDSWAKHGTLVIRPCGVLLRANETLLQPAAQKCPNVIPEKHVMAGEFQYTHHEQLLFSFPHKTNFTRRRTWQDKTRQHDKTTQNSTTYNVNSICFMTMFS